MRSSLFAAFDRYPSSKGAATHIEQSIQALFTAYPNGVLHALGDSKLLPRESINGGEIVRFTEYFPNFLDRVFAFGKHLGEQVAQEKSLQVVHFRDPWSGIPLLRRTPGNPKYIYEVNGLPSIELPSHFPDLPGSVLAKIREQEIECLEGADRVLVPSKTIAKNLEAIHSGAREKTVVIANGATLPPQQAKPVGSPDQYLLYFGALQKWQGIGTLLRAFAELSDLNLKLVIISSNKPRFTKDWLKFARRLGISSDQILWHHQLDRSELQAWIQHAMMTIAPLTECSRNIQQGCCPLKILESLAAGTAVIASDLPVVREITDKFLVRPDRPEALAFAIRELHDNAALRAELGRQGRELIANHFTWDIHHEKLADFYQGL